MLNTIIEQNNYCFENILRTRADELHPDGHQVWIMATISEFPNCVEVYIDEDKHTWSDAANFEAPREKCARGDGDIEVNRLRAARRAKTTVRKRCKMIEANQMLTLTYRENMTDTSRLQRDFKLFITRLRQYGAFEYVAGIEKQSRGALHLHLAISALPFWMRTSNGVKIKSANLVRSVWRGVVGADNGNIDLTRPRRNACHRVASYISKYISKAVEGLARGFQSQTS